LVLSIIPAQSIRAKAVTTNQQNIVDRANYFFDTTWVCQKTVYGWRDQFTYYEGETYHLPYGQPVNSGKFIGYGCTLEDFLIAAADGDSIYAVSVGDVVADQDLVGALGAEVVSEAIVRAVYNSEGAYGLPAAADLP
jgi:hypothetical protein